MRTLAAACLAFGLSLSSGALAAEPPRFPAVTDASYRETDGAKVLAVSVDVPAPAAEVWRAWTTTEGWKSFAVKNAVVDFRVGGMIETSYAETFTPGAPGNIVNEIVAYVPERMMTIRNRKAPVGFEDAAEFQRTVTVIELTPIAGGTRVSLSGVGFRPEPAFDRLYAKFSVGNAWTLDKLRQRYTGAAAAASK